MATPLLELETKQSVAMSTKIAVGFVVATAIMVVASFVAAVFVTMARPKPTTSAAGVQMMQRTVNGVTYDEAVVSTNL